MSYTEVPEQSPYDQWTAADQNTYVRDNFADMDARTAYGPLADRPAATAGMTYKATDIDVWYVCFVNGTWTEIPNFQDNNLDLTADRRQVVGGFGAKSIDGSGAVSWNDARIARSGNGQYMLRGDAAGGPGPAYYFHVFSFEYLSKNGTGNLTQIAIPHDGTGNPTFYYRHRFSGTWTAWRKIITSVNLLYEIKAIDGSGSGIDADLVDGHQSSANSSSNTVVIRDSTGRIITDGGYTIVNRSWKSRLEYAYASKTSGSGTNTVTATWPNAFNSIASAQATWSFEATSDHSITNLYYVHYSTTSLTAKCKTYGSNTLKLYAMGIGT